MLNKRSLRVESLEGRRLLNAEFSLGGNHSKVFPEVNVRTCEVTYLIVPNDREVTLPYRESKGMIRAIQGGTKEDPVCTPGQETAPVAAVDAAIVAQSDGVPDFAGSLGSHAPVRGEVTLDPETEEYVVELHKTQKGPDARGYVVELPSAAAHGIKQAIKDSELPNG